MPFRQAGDHSEGHFRTSGDQLPDSGLMDAVKSFGSGVIEGVTGAGQQLMAAAQPFKTQSAAQMAPRHGQQTDAIQGVANLIPQIPGLLAKQLNAPQNIQQGVANAGQLLTDPMSRFRQDGLIHDPQTMGGRYAQKIGMATPALAMPGSIAARVGGTVVPAAAGQTAREVTGAMGGGPRAQQAAELAAALATGALVSKATGPTVAQRMLADSTKGATDAQVQASAQRMAKGLGLPGGGVRITGDEALAQETSGGTGIQRLSRAVSNTRQGANRVAAELKNRPQQVRDASLATFDQIAPPVTNPAAVGLRGQAAAEGAIRDVKQARSAAVNPDYAAAGPQPVDPQGMTALLGDIDAAVSADKTGLVGGRLKQMRDLLAASPDVENIDRVRKFFRDRSQLPIGSTDALTGEESKAVGGFLQRLSNENGTGLLDAVQPFAAGKQKYQDITRNAVEPVTSGPVGRIAAEATDLRADPQAQGRTLFPTNPPEGAANETVAALRSMGAQDPNIGADLTRLHLTNRLNETTQNLQSGPNMSGGARFAADIAGNPEQRANLLGGIGEVAPQAAPTVADLVDALQATGMRGNEGSPTAGYQQFAKDLGVGEAPVELAKSVARPLGIPARIGGWLEQRALESNSDKLLDVLMGSPGQFEQGVLGARAKMTGQNDPLIRALIAQASAQSGASQ
jgi:hypothetical protein